MTKVYTIKEAIKELDAIRMYASMIGKKLLKREDEKLAGLVSELASVMGWLTRHVDEFESEIISEILFDTDDGPVRRSELFEVEEPPELQEVEKLHAEWDGKSPHPYGCDGKDDDDADNS